MARRDISHIWRIPKGLWRTGDSLRQARFAGLHAFIAAPLLPAGDLGESGDGLALVGMQVGAYGAGRTDTVVTARMRVICRNARSAYPLGSGSSICCVERLGRSFACPVPIFHARFPSFKLGSAPRKPAGTTSWRADGRMAIAAHAAAAVPHSRCRREICCSASHAGIRPRSPQARSCTARAFRFARGSRPPIW